MTTLVNECDPKNMYNCEEIGLFNKMLPDRTLTFKAEPCHGEKKVKKD